MSSLKMKSSTKLYPVYLDSYSEDEVELKLLRTTPACFIILGKPFSGKTTLAKKLAKEWLCPLISPDTLIEEALEDESNGYQADLKNGLAIREAAIFSLFEKRMASPDLLNTGYVLDGFPTLYDKVVSFKDQLKMIKDQNVPPNIVIHVKMPNDDIIYRRTNVRFSFTTTEFHVTEQVNPVFPKKEPPSFEELEKERLKQYQKTKDSEDTDAENTDIATEEEASLRSRQTEFPVLSQEVIESFLVSPNHTKARIERDHLAYQAKDYQIQEYILSHNRQSVIELNGNIPPKTLYKLLSTSLKMMCIKKAFIPVQLVSQEAGELENLDIIDLPSTFNFLGKMNTFAGVFRWKVSKWHRRCPVEFRKGFVVNGLPSYAVKYIDKIYFLSSEENLNLFLQNPRPYLDFSKIRYPVKFVILGHPKVGKTTISEELAFEYNVKCVQLDDILAESRQKYKDEVMAKVLMEATEKAIKDVEELIIFREQERLRKKREEELRSELAEKKGKRKGKKMKAETESAEDDDDSSAGYRKSSEFLSIPDIIISPVTSEHPEVIERVLNALKLAENEFVYPEEEQLQIITKEIDLVKPTIQAKQEIRQWVLDGFPANEKLFTMFIETLQRPSCLILLKDNSKNFSFCFNNWKASRPVEPSAFSEEVMETETEEMKTEEFSVTSEKDEEEEQEAEEMLEEFELSLDSQEEFQVFLQPYDKFVLSVADLLPSDQTISLINIDVFTFSSSLKDDVEDIGQPRSSEDIVMEITRKIEDLFHYTPRLFSIMDKDQEDEDLADTAEFVLPETDAEDQRNLMRQFGDSAYYCPVALKNRFMLVPGQVEYQAKYKDKVYRFSSKEARQEFMDNPRAFTATNKALQVPPLRIMIGGVTGSGKSTQGRNLARKLGIFHMNFKRRLRQLLFPKAGRKIGFPYQIDKEDIEMDNKEIETFGRIESAAPSLIASPIFGDRHETVDVKKVAAHLEGRKASKPNKVKGKEAKIFVDENIDEPIYPPVDSLFTPEELMYRDYLQQRIPLPPALMKSVIFPWWSEEPYKETGFVLESFPSNSVESRLLVDEGLFPDIVIIIRVTEADVIQRMMTRLMTRWHDRTKKKMEKKVTDRMKAEEARINAIAKRRVELENERKKKKGGRKRSPSQAAGDENTVDDIETQLQEEFPPLEEDEGDFETAEDAEIRLTNEVGQLFRNEEETLNKCKEVLDANNIPCIEILGNKKPELVTYLVNKAVASLVDNRESCFERTYALSNWLAEKLIGSGYKVCTNFGRWCPVQLMENCLMPPNYADDTFEPFPVLHRHHVYFLSSEEARRKFMTNPMKYICQKLPRIIIPLHISIVGPLFSGTSTLSRRFSETLGMQILSIGGCMRYVLNELPHTCLARKLLKELLSGYSARMEYIVDSIETALMQPWCQLRGAILINIPKVCAQMRMLCNNNLVPFSIFEIDITVETALERNMKMKQRAPSVYPLPDCEPLVHLYFSLLKDELGLVKEYYQRTHRNWITLNGNNSVWLMWTQARDRLDVIMHSINTYIEGTEQKKAVPITNLNITPEEFSNNTSPFQQFCPVSLVLDEELVKIEDNDFQFAAEYKGKYFKLCSADHLLKFLNNPDIYLPPINKNTVPPRDLLPRKLTSSQATRNYSYSWSFNGFCPVTYVDGYRRYDALVKGSPMFAVEYKNKGYCMENEEKREKFMRKPQKYSNVTVPSKLPPAEGSISLKKLPLLGFLEQSIASPLIEALTAVGNLKPKYPFLDPSRSALLYIAYYLKAYNPNNWQSIRDKYKRNLGTFKKRCDLLRYLCQHMTLLPWEPEKRPPDFEEKMNEFFKLQLPANWHIYTKQLPEPTHSVRS